MSNFGEQDAAMKALLGMATTPDAQSKRGTRENGGVTPQRTELSHLAKSRVRAIKGAQDLFRALPELSTIGTIAVSSILSTKDMVTTSVLYDSTDTEIPLDLRESMTGVLKDYFDTKDKFPKKLYQWLYDAMTVKGASPVMVVPEASINDMFNLNKQAVGTESFAKMIANNFEKQLGILGSINKKEGDKVGLEAILTQQSNLEKPQEFSIDFDDELFNNTLTHTYSLTDNPNVLAIGEVHRRVARENARRGLGARGRKASYKGGDRKNAVPHSDQGKRLEGQVEASDLLTVKDVNPKADETPEQSQYMEIPNTQGRSHHHPMVRLLPAESLLPIILGGDERNPIGYLVMIDDTGNPLSAKTCAHTDGALFNQMGSDIMREDIIKRNQIGMGESGVGPEIAARTIARFGEIAEEKLLSLVSNAIGGGALSLTTTQDWYRIMFSRHLAKRHTQVLYVPAENLAYFATDFNEDGIGVSITERSYILSTVRMSLMFATMNSAILNSARNLQFDIEVGANDKNAQATVDRIKADIINSYNNSLPTWGDVEDTYRASTNAGIAFNVEGNEWYPSQKVSVSDTTPDYKIPDVELDEAYLRRTCTLARVDPDLILTPENIEFASQIFSKSLIVTQQIMKIQEELSKPLTTYVQSYTYGSGPLLDELALKVAEHSPRQQNESDAEFEGRLLDIVEQFLESLEVTLPPPDTSAGESQMEQFEKRMEFFEKLGEIIVSPDVVEQMRDAGFDYDADNLKQMVVSYYARNWLRKNDVEGDMFDMFTDDNRSETVKAVSDDVQRIAKTLQQLAKRAEGKVNTVVEGDPEEGGEGGEGGFGGEDDEMSDTDNIDGEEGGDGELADDDFGGDETSGGDDDFSFDDDNTDTDNDGGSEDESADSEDDESVEEEEEPEEDEKEEKEEDI